MMRFAEEAARHLPDVEIIELHHADKPDAPSGTSMATARRMAAARDPAFAPPDAPRSASRAPEAPTSTASGSIPSACPAWSRIRR